MTDSNLHPVFQEILDSQLGIATNHIACYKLRKIMEWTNTLIDMPLCYETGAWDGKRSDEVLVEDDEGRRYVARMYSGQMDGSYFADWISNDGYIINKEIVRWLKIPA